ncbi:BON domain-containing protein [Ideonella sp. YS5]|uniref:BON domain-containing protein n=1 Tax=Ideonella sp. YS5 TaxID=3453714 RepID=UPI003EECFC28
MSWISFDREAGTQLLAPAANEGGDAPGDATLGPAIEAHVMRLGLRAERFEALYEAGRGVLLLSGCAESQDVRERIVLCCGNVHGVAAVEDRMTVLMPSDVSRWRFVQPGETLAAIAYDAYRDANRAQQLRAANQPLLGDTDQLQPGWLLRVP